MVKYTQFNGLVRFGPFYPKRTPNRESGPHWFVLVRFPYKETDRTTAELIHPELEQK